MRSYLNAEKRLVLYSLSKSRKCLSGIFALWVGCLSNTSAQENPQANWTSADAPCVRYDKMRNPVLGNIGVRIDATGPWADGFRQALVFWNSVLAANFHEEKNLSTCSVRIIDGGPDILNKGIVARSQLPEKDNFRGKIAVSPGATKMMTSSEIYAAAVHEFGHMLGLGHNASCRSVMYFLDVTGNEVLDGKDISSLSTHHKLRPAIVTTGYLPIAAFN